MVFSIFSITQNFKYTFTLYSAKIVCSRFLPIAAPSVQFLGNPGEGTTPQCWHAVDRSTSPSYFVLVLLTVRAEELHPHTGTPYTVLNQLSLSLASWTVLTEDTHQKARSFRSVLPVCVHHSKSIYPLILFCINSIKTIFLLSGLALFSSLFLFIRFFASILQAQIDKIITSYLELQTISKSKVN